MDMYRNPTYDNDLRPQRLRAFVGQQHVRQGLEVFLLAARREQRALSHMLLTGPPGLGKTTIGRIIAAEVDRPLIYCTGNMLSTVKKAVDIFEQIRLGSILFIDEIHRIGRNEETLYPLMEDFIAPSRANLTKMFRKPRFTLIGATTRQGDLSKPLLDRFPIRFEYQLYSIEELTLLIAQSATKRRMNVADTLSFAAIASRSRGTPRIANNILMNVWDVALTTRGTITLDAVKRAFELLQISKLGLTNLDIAVLRVLQSSQRSLGIMNLATQVGETKETIETLIEPWLLHCALIMRTGCGRGITQLGREYLLSL